MEKKLLWWQEGIIYQIYPRSFQDSNDDGIGDIQGIISRIDYLEWLGIKGVWIGPIYSSPMSDFGYDVKDYKSIDPIFGTEDDFDELVTQLHNRGIKLLMDFVPNHTSNLHPWFEESRSSKNSPKRDWYIWHDAKPDGTEPNNWLSAFKGSGWEWDELTKQYYFHTFHKDQPDLNWRNEEVQKAVLEAMEFWFERGVDGFRIDMLHHLIKDKLYRDNPANPTPKPDAGPYSQFIPVFSADQFYVHTVTRMMREIADKFPDRVLLGETYVSSDKLMVYNAMEKGVQLPFNFTLLNVAWNPVELASSIAKYQAGLPDFSWSNWVLGNHDRPRVAGRVGYEQAKIGAILLLTLPGTLIINYGDELGLKGTAIPFNELQDPQGKELTEINIGRDPMRTPMLWNDSKHAGFSNGEKPWLRVDKKYKQLNIESQQKDENSILILYKRLIGLRSAQKVLVDSPYYPVHADSQVLSYVRKNDQVAFLIVLNLSHRPCYFRPKNGYYKGKIILSTSYDIEGQDFENDFCLEGDEGVIVRLEVNPLP